jgi:hypothetical protein
LVRREQTIVGLDSDNKRFCERNTASTGESMSNLVNKLLKEYREAHEPQPESETGSVMGLAISARRRQEETEHSIKLFLHENDYILYMAKQQRRTTKNDILRIKNELFFSKYKVDSTPEIIRRILRDEIADFDVAAYEKRKGIKPGDK